MSWAQTDGGTTDSKLQSITDNGSITFLRAASKLQDAFMLLDQQKLIDAAATGMAAANEFADAGSNFERATQHLKEYTNTGRELGLHLKSIDYSKRIDALKLAGGQESPLARYIRREIDDGGPEGLFTAATRVAAMLRERSNDFFNEVKQTGKVDAGKSAALLASLGQALIFGACASAFLAK